MPFRLPSRTWHSHCFSIKWPQTLTLANCGGQQDGHAARPSSLGLCSELVKSSTKSARCFSFAALPGAVYDGGYCNGWPCSCALLLCLCFGYIAAWADKGCHLHLGTDTQGPWEHFFRAVPLTGCMTLVNYLISASPSRKWWWYLPASQEKHLGFIKD